MVTIEVSRPIISWHSTMTARVTPGRVIRGGALVLVMVDMTEPSG
jgi:hypothetical protein